MPTPIPESWRKAVVAILRKRTPGATIEVRQRPRRDWQAAFPDAFEYELIDELARTLSQPIEGNQVFDMTPPGDIYEFFFYHKSKKMFGKVGLHETTLVIVFSAHTPLKGDKL